jgi:hypothetical protein
MSSLDDEAMDSPGVPLRERSGTQWMPLMSLLFGVLGVALSPALGIGILPAVAGVVTGHRARRSKLGRVQSGLGLVLSYLAIAVSMAVGIVVAVPLLTGFLVSAGFLLP